MTRRSQFDRYWFMANGSNNVECHTKWNFKSTNVELIMNFVDVELNFPVQIILAPRCHIYLWFYNFIIHDFTYYWPNLWKLNFDDSTSSQENQKHHSNFIPVLVQKFQIICFPDFYVSAEKISVSIILNQNLPSWVAIRTINLTSNQKVTPLEQLHVYI